MKDNWKEKTKLNKIEIKEIIVQDFNLDYNTEMLLYRDLVVCETVTISQPKEIEVF